MNAEQQRLDEDRRRLHPWRKWGPYVSDRQWGTVREDYSADGNAWEYFSHEQARSRAYRWGEDGLAGVCDDRQTLCLALALWNGRDPVLKERLFGLANPQGNHGEDVKELYYHLDATPTASYLRMLYKYPQAAFPYEHLVAENRRRGKGDLEFELLDTGVFAEDRYFDVVVEYAKAGPDDLVMHVTAHNRGPDPAPLHLLPTVWFRNTWAWEPGSPRPVIEASGPASVVARHPALGEYHLSAPPGAEWLFCDNDTNVRRLYGIEAAGYFKDAFHDYVVHGRADAVNPARTGTKAAVPSSAVVSPGGAAVLTLRLTAGRPAGLSDARQVLSQRRAEADEFYAAVQHDLADGDAKLVQRQALAGLVWNRQFYHLDMARWVAGDPGQPPPPPGRDRNADWMHLTNADVLTMPDKWEYPYYCVWDTAFQCVALALADPEWAKHELLLLLRERYQHPNGQVPAYEWNFSDVNAPVYSWAAWRVYEQDRDARGGEGDRDFLERVLHKLLLNFTWWVNRKDARGRNVFQGGFLGMDNIGVFDRSAPLPTGGHIDQADGTAWMATFTLHLMRMSLELARTNRVYEDLATKFFRHFLHIAKAMTDMGGAGLGLWDPADEFYYDVLNLPDGRLVPMKARSMVGLMPLYAVEVIEPELLAEVPDFAYRLEEFLKRRHDLAALVSRWREPGRGERRLLSLLRGHRMKAILKRMLDETEFLSPYGVRTVSKAHGERPYRFDCCGHDLEVRYLPGESDSDMFGGNSNWRGPVWLQVAYLLVESVRRFHSYYGPDFRVECPTGSGRTTTLAGAADEVARRLCGLYLRGPDGRRPAHGQHAAFYDAAANRDLVLFYEYHHGETGRGLGASHQAGWTALVAQLLKPYRPPADCC